MRAQQLKVKHPWMGRIKILGPFLCPLPGTWNGNRGPREPSLKGFLPDPLNFPKGKPQGPRNSGVKRETRGMKKIWEVV